MLDLAKVNDPTLKRLLDMGCFDWKTPNSISSPRNGIAYSAVVASRLLPQILGILDHRKDLPLFADPEFLALEDKLCDLKVEKSLNISDLYELVFKFDERVNSSFQETATELDTIRSRLAC